MTTQVAPTGPNYALWLLWILPATAVLASFASLYLALHGGDIPLPAAYHWEGQALSGDEARQDRAKSLGVAALLQFDMTAGQCHVKLQGDAPAQLRMDLAHPTLAGADQHWLLDRDATGYHTACKALPKAHWWVQISDPAGTWQLRSRVKGDFSGGPVYITADSREG
jgi:hypothetical protein